MSKLERPTKDVCLLINGPPSSGKDTAALFIRDNYSAKYDVQLLRFSDPLKDSICSWLGIRRGSEGERLLELKKDVPDHRLNGLSYRQAQIKLSEDHIKPIYGKQQFGRWAAEKVLVKLEQAKHKTLSINRKPVMFVFPDSGFAHEAWPVQMEFVFPDFALMHLHRDTCNYDNDSRSYIELPNCPVMEVRNNGLLPDFFAEIERQVDGWLSYVEVQ